MLASMISVNITARHLRELPLIETTRDGWELRYNAHGMRYWINAQDTIRIDRRGADAKFHQFAEYQG